MTVKRLELSLASAMRDILQIPNSKSQISRPGPSRSTAFGIWDFTLSPCHFDFHELPLDFAVLGVAEEIALLLGAIVILAPKGATAVRREDYLADLALRKAVPMAAEDGLQVVFFQPPEYLFRVLRPADNPGAEWEMREDHRRPFLVQLGQRVVQPAQRRRLHD